MPPDEIESIAYSVLCEQLTQLAIAERLTNGIFAPAPDAPWLP